MQFKIIFKNIAIQNDLEQQKKDSCGFPYRFYRNSWDSNGIPKNRCHDSKRIPRKVRGLHWGYRKPSGDSKQESNTTISKPLAGNAFDACFTPPYVSLRQVIQAMHVPLTGCRVCCDGCWGVVDSQCVIFLNRNEIRICRKMSPIKKLNNPRSSTLYFNDSISKTMSWVFFFLFFGKNHATFALLEKNSKIWPWEHSDFHMFCYFEKKVAMRARWFTLYTF